MRAMLFMHFHGDKLIRMTGAIDVLDLYLSLSKSFRERV
jgi:hypothetical protein